MFKGDLNLNDFKNLDNDEPKQCGKILKSNEKIYFCQDCSRDITRIMCNDCFRHSKHREHRYKIITSDGNGYCDCGDLDAWKQFAHCDKHNSSSLSSSSKQSDNLNKIGCSVNYTIQKLSSDLIQRIEFIVKIVFDYILEIISLEEEQINPLQTCFIKTQ